MICVGSSGTRWNVIRITERCTEESSLLLKMKKNTRQSLHHATRRGQKTEQSQNKLSSLKTFFFLKKRNETIEQLGSVDTRDVSSSDVFGASDVPVVCTRLLYNNRTIEVKAKFFLSAEKNPRKQSRKEKKKKKNRPVFSPPISLV